MAESTGISRLEAFCDGVFAFALTLLVIDLKIPWSDDIRTTSDLWHSLGHLLPSVFAFLLSFTIIFITWSNHHASLKLVGKLSSAFMYANGVLLLTIVLIPFPTALLGQYLLTDHAAPAVVLYTAVDGLQAIGWILFCRTAMGTPRLAKDEKSALTLRGNGRKGYFALVFYATCATVAFWYPLTIAAIITLAWIGWLIVGINTRMQDA
jgi:uncharacterized membrane protein